MMIIKNWQRLVLVLFTFILVSCSNSGDGEGTPPVDDSNKVVANNLEIDIEEDVASDPIDVLQAIDDAAYFLESYSDPSNGVVVQDPNEFLIYQPALNFYGDDSFTYTISNGNGSELSATIVVHVSPVNDAPSAVNDDFNLVEDSPGVEIPVLSNDSDVEQEALSVSVDNNQLQAPQFGQVSVVAESRILYIPDQNYAGEDSFQYLVTDASGASAIATVNVSIFSSADRPIANIGGPYAVTVGAVFSPDGSQSFDPDGNAIQSYLWDFGDGTVGAGANPSKTYSSPGTYNLQLIVNDGESNSEPATTTVTVMAAAPFITTQPQSTTLKDGETATFSVQAMGNIPMQYQWRQNQVDIPGATSASYTTPAMVIPVSVTSHAIQYDVVITNNAGQASSQTATLTINANPPVVINQPQSQSVQDGDAVSFTVTANGSAPISYQWRKDGVAIPGANASSFSIAQAVFGQSEGSYDVLISNVVGSVMSSSVQLTVQARPVSIITQPAAVTVNEGQAAIFSVLAGGTQPFSYQWRRDGVDISGATSSQYQLAPVTFNDSGVEFSVVVSNSAGSVVSSNALLTVNANPPTITTHPVSQTVNDGDAVSFTVVAQGSLPLSYQWRRNGSNIPGATGQSLSLPSVDMTSNGETYQVLVSNSGGTAASNLANLTVQAVAPTIVVHPVDVSVYESNNATFSVVVSGSSPLIYQWRRNGISINGASNPSFTVPATTMANNGEVYDVVVSNSAGTVTSNSGMLMVFRNDAPVAGNDRATTRKNQSIVIDVLNNDTDPDGDALSLQSTGNGTMGSATIISGTPDTVEYLPQADQYGIDRFTYIVSDGKGKTASGEVTVNVTPWGAEELIGNGEGPAVSSNTNDGLSFLTWRNGSDIASSIWGTRYLPGSGWVVPQSPLASGELLNNQQVKASNQGIGIVLWQDSVTTSNDQFLRIADWNGLNWVLETVVRPDPQVPILKPVFTGSASIYFPAVWLETDIGTGQRHVVWASEAWGNSAPVTSGVADSDDPFIATSNNGTAVIVWTDVLNDNLVWRYGNNSGLIQPANLVLNTDGANVRQGRVMLNSAGQGMIIWYYDDLTGVSRLASRTITVVDANSEPVLGSEITLDNGRGNVSGAGLAIAENGNIVVVWVQEEAGGSAIWVRRITATYNVLEKISTHSGRTPVNPDVTINSNGLITVAWEEQGKIVSRRFELNGVWSYVEPLDESTSGINSTVSLDSSDNGQAVAAWQRDNKTVLAAVANIDIANVTPIPVEHSTAASGSCNNSGCHIRGSEHFNTTGECDSCHYSTLWSPTKLGNIDHNTILDGCVICHDGVIATGKSTSHINTTNECQACHFVTAVNWIPIVVVDHNQVIGSCSSCHDGIIATGKSGTHIPTTTECDLCHTTDAWIPASGGGGGGTPDHSTFIGNCITCHDGVTASGKSVSHINTSDVCDACHLPFPATWAPVPATAVDHFQVIGTCVSCHNNVIAPGKSGIHPPTTDVCDACHLPGPTPWLPVSTSLVDHNQVIGTCVSCHNGADATGKPGSHPATTDFCESCHNVPPGSWLPVVLPLNHNDVLGVCSSCHNGGIATGLPGAHCAPVGECDDCHTTNNWNAFADCPVSPPPPPAPPGLPPPPPVSPPPPGGNNPPVANAGGPYEGIVNFAVSFDGALSTDLDGDLLTYSWDFGDGTLGTGVTPTHTFTQSCVYTVTLTVSDGSAQSTSVTSATIWTLGVGMGPIPPSCN